MVRHNESLPLRKNWNFCLTIDFMTSTAGPVISASLWLKHVVAGFIVLIDCCRLKVLPWDSLPHCLQNLVYMRYSVECSISYEQRHCQLLLVAVVTTVAYWKNIGQPNGCHVIVQFCFVLCHKAGCFSDCVSHGLFYKYVCVLLLSAVLLLQLVFTRLIITRCSYHDFCISVNNYFCPVIIIIVVC